MYPLFDPNTHCAYQRCSRCIANSRAECLCRDTDDDIARILRQNNGQPPADWTRELILDPGTNNPAVLFCAVPPASLGEYYVVYDELYPGRKDAYQIAPLIKSKMGNFHFNRFIIDYAAGRQKTMSFSLTVEANYAEAMAKHGIRCANSGSHFTWGSTDVGGRIMRLQSWMHLDSRGKPRLRIVTHLCPNLCRQITDCIKAEVNDQVIDDRPAPAKRSTFFSASNTGSHPTQSTRHHPPTTQASAMVHGNGFRTSRPDKNRTPKAATSSGQCMQKPRDTRVSEIFSSRQ